MLNRRDLFKKVQYAFDNDDQETFLDMAEGSWAEGIRWTTIKTPLSSDLPLVDFIPIVPHVEQAPSPVVEEVSPDFREYLAKKHRRENISKMLLGFGIIPKPPPPKKRTGHKEYVSRTRLINALLEEGREILNSMKGGDHGL